MPSVTKSLAMFIKQLLLDFQKSIRLKSTIMMKVNLELLWLIELKNVANKILFKK